MGIRHTPSRRITQRQVQRLQYPDHLRRMLKILASIPQLIILLLVITYPSMSTLTDTMLDSLRMLIIIIITSNNSLVYSLHHRRALAVVRVQAKLIQVILPPSSEVQLAWLQ